MNSRKQLKRLVKLDHQHAWHPFTQMQEWEQEEPLIIDRAQGPYLIDLKGRRYLDGISSMWVTTHGHRHPTIDRAIRRQLTKVAHSTFLGLSNSPAILLAHELLRVAPPGLTRVFYSDNGSTAVEVALKMAVQYWQQRGAPPNSRRTFIHVASSYHGDTVGGMSVSGMGIFHERFRPLLFPTLSIDPPYCYRCPIQLSYPSCQIACLEPLERMLKERGQDIAGVVVEPLVQAVAGMVVAPVGYLRRIRELCTQYRVLLIADEVATGFGRTGRMFACEHESVTPDFMAVAKGLTGGYLPLAATLTTEEIYEAFLGEYGEWKTFFHGHSYTGNPLGCAAALANLDIFRKERTLLKMQKRIATLRGLLQSLLTLPHVGDIRQCGYMVGIELAKDRATRAPFPLTDRLGHQVAMEARQRGLLLRPLGNVIVLMPPLTLSVKDLRTMVAIVKESIDVVTRSTSL